MLSGSILIVDDEESVLETLAAVLAMDGYEVAAASSFARAKALLKQREFDLVLTDLRLDDNDGLEILAEVRQSSPETVAIMLTGYASLESAVKALREGAYDYLVKPSDVDELRMTVARGMERRQLGQELRQRVQELEAANQTIRSLNVELQQRVDEVTAAVKQRMDELARAKREVEKLYKQSQEHVVQLEELDRMKSRFLSMASHELKTPLTAISGLAQLVLRRLQRRLDQGMPDQKEWEAEQRSALQQIDLLKTQTGKLVRLVDELLDVSRIESGKLEYRYAPLSLSELAREVVERLELTTRDHTIRLTAPPPEETTLVGDCDHLEQVMNNLLGNAAKYSPEGTSIDVTVEAGETTVAVHVQDRGVGVPPDQLDAVFGLFYRAPGSSELAHTSGMGLGLYISKEIVVRHGGRIWVESELGAGSIFSFEIPRVPAAVDESPGQLPAAPPKRRARTRATSVP